jgi:hypothetical protein
MTRMLKTIMLTGTALAMLAAAPARSVEAVNGLSANGTNPNRLSANGINPNSSNPNGANPNGLNPNRLSANGISVNGANPNGFTGSERAVNSAGEIGRVIAVELPRQSGVVISVRPALP